MCAAPEDRLLSDAEWALYPSVSCNVLCRICKSQRRRPCCPCCAASLLEAQGLRATSRGGHLAVQEAVTAQFGTTVRVFRSFGRVRRARNSFEYPSSNSPGPTSDDIDDAIAVATKAREAATTILDQNVLTHW